MTNEATQRGEGIWPVVAVAVLVASTWMLLFVGLVSFGPGSVPFAALVFFAGGVGFVLASFVPFTTRARSIATSALAVGAIGLAVLSVAYTPPDREQVLAAIDDAGSFATGWSASASAGSLAPWEAPVATGGGEVYDDGHSPLDIAVGSLERRGWAVEVLRHEADGLGDWLADGRAPIAWDVAARRGRFEMRAAFDEAQMHVRLAWRPIVRTDDPFAARGASPFFLAMALGLGSAAVRTVAAAAAGMIGIVLALVSVGLAVARGIAAVHQSR